jgi:Glycosyl hydrolases family 2, sugar binding domain.
MIRTSILVMLTALGLSAASLTPRNLRLEYRTNPAGIDVAKPRFSWLLAATDPNARGLSQSAYRVIVGTASQTLWDSGKVNSDQSIHVAYAGKPLASGARAWWKVMVWDQDGRPSAWSEAARFSMGLLKPEDWKAQWIGREEPAFYKDPASPYWHLAKAKWIWPAEGTTFTVPADRKVKKAIAVMGAAGRFELTLNGTLVGQGRNVAMPDLFYITELIRPGENTVSVRAEGPRKGPAGLIGAIRVEFDSGEPLMVVTDAAWRTAKVLGDCGMAPWAKLALRKSARCRPG